MGEDIHEMEESFRQIISYLIQTPKANAAFSVVQCCNIPLLLKNTLAHMLHILWKECSYENS